ncbi:MAG: cytochrome c oxidase subunit 3 [Acidobacteriota bacterium]|jgi:cytochrome c oxidase subunit 3
MSATREATIPADSAFRSVEQRRYAVQLGVWCFLAVVTMLFASFTSSYIVRQAGMDWDPTPLPRVLWFNTALLVLSSVALEVARRDARRGRLAGARTALFATVLLGVGFVVGQFAAWRDLAAAGYYLPTSPHASFFYILTALHIAHLAAGLILLLYITERVSFSPRRGDGEEMPFLLGVGATFWHFFGALWIYLFALLALV